MPDLLRPIHQVVDIPLNQLPSTSDWEKLSPYWPTVDDQQIPAQWTAKVTLFQYLAKAWGAISDDSYRALCSDLRVFFSWCRAHELPNFPAAPTTVVAFIEDQAGCKQKNTVRRYMASLAKAHQQANVPNPMQHQDVQLAYQRLYRDHSAEPAQAQGLRWDIIERALSNLGDSLRDTCDRALVLVAYDVLARPSEIQRLTLDSLTAGDHGHRLQVVRSKKSNKGRVQHKFVAPSTVEAINVWLQRSGIQTGSLFRGINKSGVILDQPLSAMGITRAMQRIAKAADHNPKGFSGHSARIGACQDMAVAGSDIVKIMLAGDWSSPEMPAYYARKIASDKSGMADLAKSQGR